MQERWSSVFLYLPGSVYRKRCLLVDICSKESYNAHLFQMGRNGSLCSCGKKCENIVHEQKCFDREYHTSIAKRSMRKKDASHQKDQAQGNCPRCRHARMDARQMPGMCAMRRFVVSLAQPGRTEKEVLGSTTYLGSEKSKGTVACC